jgi:glutamate/tyrosine decarboxylase-like PLP-dependent enzyme
MNVSALERAIAQDRDNGTVPFLVVGTAGTTGSGAVDPLIPLASLAKHHGLWFHVDAAWGGFACMSPIHQVHLDGIQQADSVTWDAHKGLSVPLGAGMFFCRRRAALAETFGLSTGYMPAATDGIHEPYVSSLQWSRRFIGLTVFMALAELGEAGFATQIEHQFRMGALLRRGLTARGWDVVNITPFPIVCFTRTGLPNTESDLDQFLASLLARGKVWISRVLLPRKGWVLRACITSFLTDEKDVTILLDELDTSWST